MPFIYLLYFIPNSIAVDPLEVPLVFHEIGHLRFKSKEPKTRRSCRTLDLPAISIAALQRHRIWQAEERLLAGSEWEGWGLVFTTCRGTPLDASNVTRAFQRELRKAKLRH